MSVPYQMAGAETMAHRMAKFLVGKGHEVIVLCPGEDIVFEGVTIWNNAKSERMHKLWESADLVFTHLDRTSHTENAAKYYKKKVVHIIHNSHNDSFLRCRLPNQYLVYNSSWVKDKLRYKQESIVLNPPVDYRDYQGVNNKNAKYVTLINLNENKGGQILIDLAKRMPDTQFLGVEGGYYDQIKSNEKNIKYVPQTKDIREYLKDTKILIVPSEYESWGQVAIEAASMGIPVIASTAEGLKSSLSDSGVFVERNDLDGWEFQIRELLTNNKAYKKQSDLVYERALELDPLIQLENFNNWLGEIHNKPYLQ